MDIDPRFSPPGRDWSPDVDRARGRGRFSDFYQRDFPGGRLPAVAGGSAFGAAGPREHFGKTGPNDYLRADYYDSNWLRHTDAVGRREIPGSDARSREHTLESYGPSEFGRARFGVAWSPEALAGVVLVVLIVFLFAQVAFVFVAVNLVLSLHSGGQKTSSPASA